VLNTCAIILNRNDEQTWTNCSRRNWLQMSAGSTWHRDTFTLIYYEHEFNTGNLHWRGSNITLRTGIKKVEPQITRALYVKLPIPTRICISLPNMENNPFFSKLNHRACYHSNIHCAILLSLTSEARHSTLSDSIFCVGAFTMNDKARWKQTLQTYTT
jgi:hypothetical protein